MKLLNFDGGVSLTPNSTDDPPNIHPTSFSPLNECVRDISFSLRPKYVVGFPLFATDSYAFLSIRLILAPGTLVLDRLSFILRL